MLKSLCLVDDDEIDTYQVKRIVNKSGLVEKFYSFADGQEALDHFLNFEESQKELNSYFPPKVIVLDVNMPRMNGFQFLSEYQKLPEEKKKSLVIVMLTSSSQEKDKENAKKYPNVLDYFIKPFTRETLQKIIDKVDTD